LNMEKTNKDSKKEEEKAAQQIFEKQKLFGC
jgi:hypothetical protein